MKEPYRKGKQRIHPGLETGNSAERENQKPSRSWVSPTSVGSASATELSSSGGLRRRSEWSRSSKPSRPSFDAVCVSTKHHDPWTASLTGLSPTATSY